ncbi:conserved hypothetical Ustilaginaceae-specific protein [Sporisorium reilianum SRZ2]|uniref:Conserved hypothetical Ustilaginaceae-specific protein n=1 Tax=Sporisorium reilianum (strain SRZ2) TaxID=999809 RepID=E6ZSI2_SPORE|nr:conserved hypothetical Ustilaginaceae-specific protein [Sporisorium reilianum SRZ2]
MAECNKTKDKDAQDEAVVQYETPHAAGRDRRGVCVYALHGQPTLPFAQLLQTLSTVYIALNPNVVRFRMPAYLRPPFWHRAQQQLSQAFSQAFPHKQAATIRLFENAQGYRQIDIETPYDNVPAEEIIRAASECAWKVGHALLGAPLFVGLPSSALVYPMKLDNVPLEKLDEFVASLPGFFAQFVPPSAPLRVVDVWKVETKVCMTHALIGAQTTHWLYADSLVVLVEFLSLPASGRIYDLVHDWPGWALWNNSVLVHLHYPGRFDYCHFCKYHAQHHAQRHPISDCVKLVCGKCGNTGHSEAFCRADGVSQNKRHDGEWRANEAKVDEEGKRRFAYGSSDYWDRKLRRTEGLAQTKLLIASALAHDDEGKSADKGWDEKDVPHVGVDLAKEEEQQDEQMEMPGSFPTPLCERVAL